MAIKLTQKKPHAHVILRTGKAALILKPGIPTYLTDEEWDEVEGGSHHAMKAGKPVSTMGLLIKKGHLTADKVSDEEMAQATGEEDERTAAAAPGFTGSAEHLDPDNEGLEPTEPNAETEPEEETDAETGHKRKKRRG